jgi:hypothetical protein
MTKTQLVYLLAGRGDADPRTVAKYLDDPTSVRPALRQRLDQARASIEASTVAPSSPPHAP